MSSDTAKENASVVDSSVTEWKFEKGNLDDQESPRCRQNEGPCHSGAEDQAHSSQPAQTSLLKKGKLYKTRYFIIKSLNHENIQLSVRKGIWATQVMNEPILEEAFHSSSKVILVFSVNMSGFFQGYAQMMSSVGGRRDEVWGQGNGGRTPWGRSFKVKWLRLYDLPFQKTLHLKNPLNDYKPVKISRDCQELPPDIGKELCDLLDGKNDLDVHLNRRNLSADRIPSGRIHIELPDFMQREACSTPAVHMAHMLYPSLVYHHQDDTDNFQLTHHRSSGMFLPESSSTVPVGSTPKVSKHSRADGNLSDSHRDESQCSRFDVWGFSGELSPLGSTLTEDDILDMTYEEYLEAHSRGNKRSYCMATEQSWNARKSVVNKEKCDDSQLDCAPRKRSCHQTLRSSAGAIPWK